MTRSFVLTGRTVLYGLLGFFGTVIAVNGAFVYFALESWPGLSATDAYRRGLAYNDTLAQANAQARLGWRSTLAAARTNDGAQRVEIHMGTRDGAPLSGLTVRIAFGRPVGNGERITQDCLDIL